MVSITNIINENVNSTFERRVKSLTKYERQFIHKFLDEWEKTNDTMTKIQMIELYKKVKKLKITKKNLINYLAEEK
jgi:hypothetical protein